MGALKEQRNDEREGVPINSGGRTMNSELSAPHKLIERLAGIDDPTALLDSYGRIVAVNSLWRGSAETSSHVASEDAVEKDYSGKDYFDAFGLGDVLSEQE